MVRLFNNNYKNLNQAMGVMFSPKDKKSIDYSNLVKYANNEIGVSLARIATALEKLAGIEDSDGASQ